MNQKIDKMMSQKFTADSDLDGRGGCSLRIVSIAESGPGSLTHAGRSRGHLPPVAPDPLGRRWDSHGVDR